MQASRKGRDWHACVDLLVMKNDRLASCESQPDLGLFKDNGDELGRVPNSQSTIRSGHSMP